MRRRTSIVGYEHPELELMSAVQRRLPTRARVPRSGPEPDLPSETAQARRFEQARAARSAAMFEDYVELIDDLIRTTGEARATDIAKRLGVSHPTVIKTIGRLKRQSLAESRPYRGVFLTQAGADLAAKVRDRHHLVVEFLLAVGVPAEAAEGDAEGLEHHVSDVTLKAFAKFLRGQRAAAGG